MSKWGCAGDESFLDTLKLQQFQFAEHGSLEAVQYRFRRLVWRHMGGHSIAH